MTPHIDSYSAMAAAYVHVPFCAEVCPYCDFAVVAGSDHLAGRYANAVVSEIESRGPWRALDAVYVGGGTPSHVSPELLGLILSKLDEVHGLSEGSEVSLEANPEDFSLDRALALRSLGFNRVSFGGQSFDSSVLAELGRRHDPEDIAASARCAREAGFDNISMDLIFGTPGETSASWEHTLEAAMAAKPTHISCYALTVEPGTALGSAVKAGAMAPDPDVQADRYETAVDVLGRGGFTRYEVSNWARDGKQCRYNLIVWSQGEYEAYGNGAHRFRAGRRSRNHRRLDAYMNVVEAGAQPQAGSDRIAGWDGEIDRLFVGLRRRSGVAIGIGGEALLESVDGRRLVDAGVLRRSGDRLYVDRPLMTDEVNRALFGLEEPSGTDNVYGRTHA